MAKSDLEWVVSQVNEWRKEAGIRKRLRIRQLEKVLAKVGNAGEPEDWVVFVILACEWLFRQKKIGKAEVDEALAKIETALRGAMHEMAWVVTEALKPRVSELLKKENRMLPAFDLYRREDLLTTQLRTDRSRPQRLAPIRPGPPSWPAPWMAGAIVAKRIGDKRKKGGPKLAADLVETLSGIKIVDPRSLRRIRARLKGPDLDNFVKQLEQRFGDCVEQSPDRKGVSAKKLAVIRPINLFPADPQLVTRLFDAYAPRTRSRK